MPTPTPTPTPTPSAASLFKCNERLDVALVLDKGSCHRGAIAQLAAAVQEVTSHFELVQGLVQVSVVELGLGSAVTVAVPLTNDTDAIHRAIRRARPACSAPAVAAESATGAKVWPGV